MHDTTWWQSLSFWSAVTLYALATVGYLTATAFDRKRPARWGFGLAAAALVPHAAALALRWIEVGHGPYSSRYEVVSSNVFLLIAAWLAVALKSKSLRGLGVFVLPVAFLALGWGVSYFGLKSEVPIIFRSYWLFLHIGFAKLFGATVFLAAGCAVAYLVKRRSPERLAGLPEPVKLELYAHQLLLVSFFFLGVMIAAGSLWAHQSWGRYWGWDPIETSALVTWIAFGIILHFRVLHRWSGRRMAWLTLVALGFAVATLYVVTLVVPTIHNAYMVGS